MHNIFFSYEKNKIMVLDDKILDEILEYLDKSINNLAKEAIENIELEGGFQGVREFLHSTT